MVYHILRRSYLVHFGFPFPVALLYLGCIQKRLRVNSTPLGEFQRYRRVDDKISSIWFGSLAQSMKNCSFSKTRLYSIRIIRLDVVNLDQWCCNSLQDLVQLHHLRAASITKICQGIRSPHQSTYIVYSSKSTIFNNPHYFFLLLAEMVKVLEHTIYLKIK